MNTEQLNAEKTVLVMRRELSKLKITLANERAYHSKREQLFIYGNAEKGVVPLYERSIKRNNGIFERLEKELKSSNEGRSKLEKQLEDMTDERDVYKQKYEDKMDETSNEYPDGVAEAIADAIAADNLIEMSTQSNFMVDALIDDGAPGAYAPWVVTGEDD